MSTIILSISFVIVIGFIVLLAYASFVAGKEKAEEGFGNFTRRPLLNKAEKQLVLDLDVVIPEVFGPTARMLSQVSYGEFLKGEDRSAHARINQKRADFVVVDAGFELLCVIEYQGSGHYGRGEKARANAEHRDRVKRAACTSAGIPFVEIPAKFSLDILREKLVEHMSNAQAV
jgi:hypothetical protein